MEKNYAKNYDEIDYPETQLPILTLEILNQCLKNGKKKLTDLLFKENPFMERSLSVYACIQLINAQQWTSKKI